MRVTALRMMRNAYGWTTTVTTGRVKRQPVTAVLTRRLVLNDQNWTALNGQNLTMTRLAFLLVDLCCLTCCAGVQGSG